MSSNELERIYNQVRIVDDPYSTSQICANLFENNLFGFRVYCSLEISCLKNYSVYNNDELKITLIVIFENRLTRWLSMSKSTITGAGFGVFAEKPFRKNEFITVYLGKKVDYTYMHGNVVGLPSGYEFKGNSKNVIVRQWNSVGRASRSIALPSAGAPGSRVEEL